VALELRKREREEEIGLLYKNYVYTRKKYDRWQIGEDM
jgi:hypothetical protein